MASLITVAELRERTGHQQSLDDSVARHRAAVRDIMTGRSDRLLVVVGPCSAHEPTAMIQYAQRLRKLADEFRDDLYLVLRAYGEKPRTRHGWPGMVMDPRLDGSNQVNDGIIAFRAMLSRVVELDVPVACEFVEPMLAPYFADLASWGAIGARTVDSPPHRRLASILDMAIGMKNRADGSLGSAVDAIEVASRPQPIVGVNSHGEPHWELSNGNPLAHLVLRGSDSGGNYEAHQINHALSLLDPRSANARVMVDCSHGNSGKDHRRQPIVAANVAAQIAAGQFGIAGVMIESFLREGRQNLSPPLEHGVSVTDACLDIDHTEAVLNDLAVASSKRRANSDLVVTS